MQSAELKTGCSRRLSGSVQKYTKRRELFREKTSTGAFFHVGPLIVEKRCAREKSSSISRYGLRFSALTCVCFPSYLNVYNRPLPTASPTMVIPTPYSLTRNIVLVPVSTVLLPRRTLHATSDTAAVSSKKPLSTSPRTPKSKYMMP